MVRFVFQAFPTLLLTGVDVSFLLKKSSVRYLASVIQFGALSHCLLEHVVEVQMVGCCSALFSHVSGLTHFSIR